MQQLYYTSCVPGRSVSGQGGFQIRAASPQLAADQQRDLLALLGYRLPLGYDDDTPAEQSPVRLALLESSGGRCLVRSVPAGRDPTTQRSGNFFSHLLTGLPEDFTASEAASLIEAPFWVQADGAYPAALPVLEPFPLLQNPPKVNAADAKGKALLQFLALGLLGLQQGQRLYIVAEPEQIAWAIHTLGHFLPRHFLRKVTFSTYEREPLVSPATVVGTWWRDANLDLEPFCYDGAGLAFNTITSRTSALPPPSEFGRFVLEALNREDATKIREFEKECSPLLLESVESMDLAYAILRGDPKRLSRDQLACGFAIPDFARRFCESDEIAGIAVDTLFVDSEFCRSHCTVLADSIRPPQRFGSLVADRVVDSLLDGDSEAALRGLQSIYPRFAAEARAVFEGRLCAKINPHTVPDSTWMDVLPCILKIFAENEGEKQRWSAGSPDRLRLVLDSSLDQNQKLALCEIMLRGAQESERPLFVDLITSSSDFARRLMERLAGKHDPGKLRSVPPGENGRARNTPADDELLGELLVECIGRSSPVVGRGGSAPVALGFFKTHDDSYAPATVRTILRESIQLARDGMLSKEWLERGYLAVFERGDFSPVHFITSADYKVFHSENYHEANATLAERVLAATAPRLSIPRVVEFLNYFISSEGAQWMDRKKCGALEEIVRLDSFVKNPELKKAPLRSACDTLRTLRGGDYDHIRGTLLAEACAKLLETSRPGPDLESLVGEIPPTASQAGGDPSGNQARILVFVEICDRFRGEKGFRITPGVLMALLELGSELAAGSSPSATGGRSIRRDLWRFVRGLLRRNPPEAVGGHVDRAIKQLLNSIAKTYSRGELSPLLTALRETSKARLNPQIQDHLRLLQPRPLYRIIWVFLVFVFLLTGIVCFFVLYFFRKLISALG